LSVYFAEEREEMELIDIKIFLAIVKHRNISKAADSLFLSQPNVSRRLQQLELAMNTKLIYRRKGQNIVELTESGKMFLGIAQRWLSIYDEAMVISERPERIMLSISGVHSVNFGVFEPLYKELTQHSPPIDLYLQTHHTLEIYDLMESRQLDVGFVNYTMAHPDINAKPIIRERFLVLRRAREAVKPAPIHPSELNPDKEVCHEWFPEYQHWHDHWWKPTHSNVVKLNFSFTLDMFLSDEENWAIVPLSIAKKFEQSGNFNAWELLEPPPDRICYLLTLKQHRPSGVKSMSVFYKNLDKFLTGFEYAI